MNTPSGAGEEAVPVLGPLALPAGGQGALRGTMRAPAADARGRPSRDGGLPPGAWLREAEVARELKVSRTPVRDAFRILASEGLVLINDNHVAIVRPLTTE